MYIYLHIYVCVCMCVCVSGYMLKFKYLQAINVEFKLSWSYPVAQEMQISDFLVDKYKS